MTLEEIQERLYSTTGITPVKPGPGWGRSKTRDENAERLATYEGYTGLDKIAMDAMMQGYNVEDPTKTMTGLLETLAPNLSGWDASTSAPYIATRVSMNTGILPKFRGNVTRPMEDPGIQAAMRGYASSGKGRPAGGVSQHDKWARQANAYRNNPKSLPGIIGMLAGSYTGRIRDYLDRFQDLPDIRAAAEKVTEVIDDEDKLASVWT
jgi:hypothetical protein|tara:strand:+ start:108 stop:731 length:624 start_codon:yes stop_codon:yes gene_type:complete